MNIIISIFAWTVYSVITLLIITNVICEIYDKWFSNFYINLVGLIITCCGILIYSVSTMQFGSLKKLSGTKEDTLETKGIYMHSRNPQFLGWWLLLIGLFIMQPNYLSLSLFLLGILFGFIQIKFEERSLFLRYGDQYIEYMSSVRRII